MTTLLAVFSGFLLSWLELSWMRRQVTRLFENPLQSKSWAKLFVLRWGFVALALSAFIVKLKSNPLPFIVSFLVSNFALRLWYGRKVYA